MGTTTDRHLVRARNQLLTGVVLLVVGVLLATGLVLGEATVAAGIGYAAGIAGLILIGNSLVAKRRGDG
jgi:uncharacterized membrane protein HdeD (DUF308 family)